MSSWDEYPLTYRNSEVSLILAAVRAGECVSIVGLSGAGKSNLMGFLYHRCKQNNPAFILVDGNRAQPRSAIGLYRLTRQTLGSLDPADDEYTALDATISRYFRDSPGNLSLLFDRYDALDAEERCLAAGPLRALRDAHKYHLTYILASRRPPHADDELAELFYAHTLWLGPLNQADAQWSTAQFAARRGLAWDEAAIQRLIDISWGYPALLRACCEAYAGGARLEELEEIRSHPSVQHRVQEFWADQPSAADLRQSGISGQPLLGAPPINIQAASPGLTASEHLLLAFFQAHPGEVCGKDDLIRAVWPGDKVIIGLRDDSLAQLIRRLRQKVEMDPANPLHILTVPGRGYRYQE